MLSQRYQIEMGMVPSGMSKEHVQASPELFHAHITKCQIWSEVQSVFYKFQEKVCQHELVKTRSFLEKIKNGEDVGGGEFSYEIVRELRKDKKLDKFHYTFPKDTFAFFLVTNIHTKAQRGCAWLYLDKPRPEKFKNLSWFRYVWFGTADF